MKKILIAIDKFKFTLTAGQVTEAISIGISDRSDLLIQKFPIADGGEGTADILSRFYDCKKIITEVNDPLFRKIKTHYYYSADDHTAIMDLSSASGLFLLKESERDPLLTSTYGTGEMILNAVNKGANKIILGLGGSATNDASTGAAHALGYRFLNNKGESLIPTGKNLLNISEIDYTNLSIDTEKINISVLYDVNNILYGKNGAARVYSKQKGANSKSVKILDAGLKNFSGLVKKQMNKDISGMKGSGAAGGFAGGAYALLNAKLQSGSDTLLQSANFDSIIKDIDLIITGEGKFDQQSFEGKITGKIIEKANRQNIPVIVICGQCELDPKSVKYKNILSIHPLFTDKVDINKAKDVSFNLIIKITQQLFKNLQLL